MCGERRVNQGAGAVGPRFTATALPPDSHGARDDVSLR